MSRTVSAYDPSIFSFIPQRLLERLYGVDGNRPNAQEFPAAVLYVDVSRYSSLVEQMAHRGKEGLEQIPELLSRSYARCVEHVHDLGGEVAQFAGDSLVAYWSAEEGGLDDALAAATNCANQVCISDSTELKNRIASFHAGIGTGLLWSAAVGGTKNHWNLLVGGSAFRRAAAAHAHAHPGNHNVVVAPEDEVAPSRKEPGQRAAGGPFVPGRMLSPIPSAAWFAEFLPEKFGQMLSSASDVKKSNELILGLDALTEFRPVSVLFARIEGLDETQQDALTSHHRLCEGLQSIMASYDGPAGELLIDDKGLVFLTVFGEPGTFHKDDPVRALNAALGMTRLISDHGLAGAVGVASGEALFGIVGPARRRVFMTFGAPMNRAARLMSVAGTGVLCDGPTERAARGEFFDFTDAGQFMLTGIGQTSTGFRPTRKVRPARWAAKETGAIIGRQVELEWLSKVLEESQLEQRRLVIVAGETGIGKSRLLESFLQTARDRGRLTALAHIDRGDRQRLLTPWRVVLETLLGHSAGPDAGDLADDLRRRLAGRVDFEQRLPLLTPLLSVEMDDTEATSHLQGANRADATMRFVVDVLEVLAPAGFVIALEDCQWMDSASWRVAEWLARRLPSLLLVMTVRQEEGPTEYRSLRQRIEQARFHSHDTEGDLVARAARVLDLEPLSDGSIHDLIKRTLGDIPVSDELAQSLCAVARGNPFFAEESALALRSEGLIAVLNGRWSPSQSFDRLERERLERFDAVERVVRERVDRLDPAEQLVLKAAAVIGRIFDAQTLETLLKNDVTISVINDCLAALESRRLVVSIDRTACSFQFRHDHTRDVVYDAIPATVRQDLHRRLAAWLEESNRDQTRPDLATLVRHWDAGGDARKAVTYADAAAAQALRSGAFREAEEFLGICLARTKLQDGLPVIRRIQWQRALAEAQYGRGNLAAYGEAVKRALILAGRPLPGSRHGAAGRLGIEILRTAAQQLWPQLFARVQPDQKRVFQLELARCNSQAATFYYFSQDILGCLLASLAAVNAVDRSGAGPDWVRAYAQIGCALGIGGYPHLADHFLGKAEKMAETQDDPTMLAVALLLDALYRIGHGAWDAVARNLDRSQNLSTAAGDHVNWCNAQAVRFWMHSYQGRRAAAEQTAQLLLSRAQNSGNIQQEIWALRCKALCALAGDRPRHASDLLRMALAALPKSSDVSELIASRGCLALALTRSGEHREGVQEAVATIELFTRRRKPTVHSTLDGTSAVAEVLLRGRQEGLSQDFAEWSQWEAITLREIDRHRRTFPVASARFGLWRGLALWLDGRRHQAIQMWEQALEIAQQLGLRQDEALIAAELRHREHA